MIERQNTLNGSGLRISIVAARFNDAIVRQLVHGAHDTLLRLGVGDDDIDLTWVPGAFELPLVAKLRAESGVDAVICLGAVIRGATPHFDYVCSQAASWHRVGECRHRRTHNFWCAHNRHHRSSCGAGRHQVGQQGI